MGAYRDSNSCARFLSNLVLFLVYPCMCCWQFLNRTFEPWDRPRPKSEDGLENETDLDEYDLRLQRQGLLRGSTLVQRQVQLTTISPTQANTTSGSGSEELEEEDPDSKRGRSDDELSKLLTRIGESDREEEEDRYPGRYSNTEDEATDTRYVLNVMNESRKSLRAVHSSSSLGPDAFAPGEETAQTNRDRADQLVADLLGAKFVFRRLEASCGRVLMPESHPYSLQGYFIAVGPDRYQFFTHASLKQFWTVEERTLQVVQMEPRVLCSGTFTQTYNSKMEVWLASDLSVQPRQGAPVINVEYQ
ncbi:uncharacterized protein LOC120423718 [Culex pipiens pallens]|uniref:uncharacterized protein LOC120423718 n=1 Tax=Culex pipiens pallens TaxID=42434 RepID=UPI0022AA2E61|nr:uncharacterized protein LOC120423718 [Culex pipiens pallens]XP_052562020.1 uncharacterized protein LOC120423718 [Culex pipiens pallens]